ncbi:hypothetical protein D1871_15680 [Nakamurella silvestris]|nr:hypothetical protein D1871_15680 [Nakamurella silvestris]
MDFDYDSTDNGFATGFDGGLDGNGFDGGFDGAGFESAPFDPSGGFVPGDDGTGFDGTGFGGTGFDGTGFDTFPGDTGVTAVDGTGFAPLPGTEALDPSYRLDPSGMPTYNPVTPADGFAFDPNFGIPGLPSVDALNQFVDNSLADTTAQLDQAVQQSDQFSDQMQQGIDTLNADGRFDDYLNQMDRQDAQMVNNYNQDINNSWAQTNADSNAAADERSQQFRDGL